MSTAKLEAVDESREVGRVNGCRVYIRTVANPRVGIMISLAVGNHSKTLGERLELLSPRTQIGGAAAVNEDDRCAAPQLYVGKSDVAMVELPEIVLH